MTRKILGKISFAEFGVIRDYPFLMGLNLGFTLGDGCSICDGGKYTVNVGDSCKWSQRERQESITAMVDKVRDILKDAKALSVSELINKPVEVTIEDDTFKDFRILTEVL